MVRTVVTNGGRRLTAADIERLATSLEQDLDVKSWAPRPGRPSLGDSPGVHSPKIAVRLPEDLHRRALCVDVKNLYGRDHRAELYRSRRAA